jgi:hypothetical protein
METVLDIGVGILRLVPLILAFYIPALFGMAIWSERGEGYTIKTILWFAIGFGAIVTLHVLFRSGPAVQVIGVSVVQIVAALCLAALTVYKLAD